MKPLIWSSDSLPRYEGCPSVRFRLRNIAIGTVAFSLWAVFWWTVIEVFG